MRDETYSYYVAKYCFEDESDKARLSPLRLALWLSRMRYYSSVEGEVLATAFLAIDGKDH